MTGQTEKEPPTKRCPACGKIKLLSQFHRNKYRADGHSWNCARCKNGVEANRYHTRKKLRQEESRVDR